MASLIAFFKTEVFTKWSANIVNFFIWSFDKAKLIEKIKTTVNPHEIRSRGQKREAQIMRQALCLVDEEGPEGVQEIGSQVFGQHGGYLREREPTSHFPSSFDISRLESRQKKGKVRSKSQLRKTICFVLIGGHPSESGRRSTR